MAYRHQACSAAGDGMPEGNFAPRGKEGKSVADADSAAGIGMPSGNFASRSHSDGKGVPSESGPQGEMMGATKLFDRASHSDAPMDSGWHTHEYAAPETHKDPAMKVERGPEHGDRSEPELR